MPRLSPNGKRLATQQSVNSAIWSICNIMRRSNCAGALQYVPELTWILFLRILDEQETREADEARAVGAEFSPSLDAPYRWQDWATPGGPKRLELTTKGTLGAFFSFALQIKERVVDADREPDEQHDRRRGAVDIRQVHEQPAGACGRRRARDAAVPPRATHADHSGIQRHGQRGYRRLAGGVRRGPTGRSLATPPPGCRRAHG